MLTNSIFLVFIGHFTYVSAEDCTKHVCQLTDNHLRFFLLGDWGGLPIWPYYTPAQTTVAETIGLMARSKGTKFQIALGDNFYMVGVSNVHDNRFMATFENVYTQSALRRTPWYVIAGNHDHNGNTSAQIAYSQRSWRWSFPSLNYSVNYQLANGTTAEFIMIDTVILCGQTRDGQFDGVFQYLMASSSVPHGPKDKQKANEQWEWIEQKLQSSKADYLFVVGHYPIYSVADHGPTKCLVNKLNPMLIKYNASAYFCGHDHNLQHLQINRPNSEPLHYVVSGGGAFLDASDAHKHEVPFNSSVFSFPQPSWSNLFENVGFSTGGFVYADLTPSETRFSYFSGDRKFLHEFSLKPRSL